MYISNNFTKNNVGNIDLIDPTRPATEVVLSLPYSDLRRFKQYTNDGIKMTIKYNRDYSEKKIIKYKKMTKEELEHAKEKYIQAGKDCEKFWEDAKSNKSHSTFDN